jgi:hypothetical protein
MNLWITGEPSVDTQTRPRRHKTGRSQPVVATVAVLTSEAGLPTHREAGVAADRYHSNRPGEGDSPPRGRWRVAGALRSGPRPLHSMPAGAGSAVALR